jgi:aerotaxis receptor
MKRPTPIDAAREFRINEMFFSTTDRAGRILSGNTVFSRVSAYPLEALIGQPHNIIRHPDMPRAVFRIIWEHLLGGRPVCGFVKNMAADGRHYWVVAFLMPLRTGFLSVRFRPSSELQPVAAALYAEMLACEREQEAAGADRATAMRQSEERLLRALRSRGFDSYEAFMRIVLREEMKSRDAVLATQGLALFPGETVPAGDSSEAAVLLAIDRESRRAYEQINSLYAQLDEFAALNDDIAGKSGRVLEHTADFRFIAFNASLRSARLGEEARALGVIAEYLGTTSGTTTALVRGLTKRIDAVSAKLRSVIFDLAAARLQIEMVLSFGAEMAHALREPAAAGRDAADSRRGMITDLQQAFAATIHGAVGRLGELEHELTDLGANTEDLRRNVLTLQVAQVGGLVEASRLQGDDSFSTMFGDLRGRVEATKRELEELNEVSSRLAVLAGRTPAIAAVISDAVERMGAEVKVLASAALPAMPDVPTSGSALVAPRLPEQPAAIELMAN